MKRGRANSTFSMDPRVDDLQAQFKLATGVGKSELTERALLVALSGKSKLFNETLRKLQKSTPTAHTLNAINAAAQKLLEELTHERHSR